MIDKQIMNILVKAVKDFYRKESRFISDRVCERAIVGRILIYMSKIAQKYDLEVFTEFNRMYRETVDFAMTKSLDCYLGERNTNYPDILVLKCDEHMKPFENVLVVEAKYADSARDNKLDDDIYKLKYFTREPQELERRNHIYAYPLGCHVFFDNDIFVVLWYKNGIPFQEDIYKKNDNRFRRNTNTKVATRYEYDINAHQLYFHEHDDGVEQRLFREV